MKTIFITGTAGSGKSLFTSNIYKYYEKNNIFSSILNLDPGVENLPYQCELDVRENIDIMSIMRKYKLGPNGALVLAVDMIATRLDEIQNDIDKINPDYLIVDTPGQIELFAYRSSGRFIVHELQADKKVNIFLYDGMMVQEPTNFLSISLLSASTGLRYNVPTINILTKTDLIEQSVNNILKWSTDSNILENHISKEKNDEKYIFMTSILNGLKNCDLLNELIPVSNITSEGINNVSISLDRIMNVEEDI